MIYLLIFHPDRHNTKQVFLKLVNYVYIISKICIKWLHTLKVTNILTDALSNASYLAVVIVPLKNYIIILGFLIGFTYDILVWRFYVQKI